MQNRNHTLIYSTTDSGQSWNKSKLPFILNGKLKLLVVDADSYSVLAMEANTKTLFVSIGDDSSWKSALQDVQDFFWSRFTFDPKDTIYALHGKSPKKRRSYFLSSYTILLDYYFIDNLTTATSNRDAYTLSKSEDGGSTWRVLLRNVRKIWAPETYTDADDDDPKSGPAGRFLYAAHFTEDADNEKGPLKLSVSEDGGNTFHPVFLPAVTSDRFFSVLEIERDCVFLHVDEPGDTGHGILYVSDSTGTVFTESLRRHFYPNQATVTDFFRVLSIPGTFLATQMNPDTTLRTVITHNRGATWQPLPVPQGLSCDPPRSKMIQGEQSRIVPPDYSNSAERLKAVCGLQVSNQFSLRKRVVASPPLAISSARGLILVHGHVATHLKTTPADVFISDDGGYTWYKGLDGPHHYQIGNRGGLLVAVPADTLWVDILRFSTDGGRCWHNIPLTPFKSTSEDDIEKAHTGTTQSPPVQQVSTISPDTVTLRTATLSPLHPMEEETVVFTGLVTEPGGRAMAVAVYGYGTVSQRWRVAVVDFANNGFITKNCKLFVLPPRCLSHLVHYAMLINTWRGLRLRHRNSSSTIPVFLCSFTPIQVKVNSESVLSALSRAMAMVIDVFVKQNLGKVLACWRQGTVGDYELWYPHRTDTKQSDPSNGCLLGVRETSYRLKENSLCFSNSDFRSLQSYEICECTELDYECEYGYWRDSSGKCVENPHAPPLDICDLVGLESSHHLFQMIGYRKVPGTRCQGGWEPPHSNMTFEERTRHCPPKFGPGFGLSTKILIFIIALMVILAIIGAFLYYRRRKDASTVLRQYRRVPDVFRRCLQHSHLVSNHRGFKTAPNAVFFASGDNVVLKTSGISQSYLPPQITNFGPNRQKEGDRTVLLEDEELCEEDEPLTTITSSSNDQAQNDEKGRYKFL
ncbi:unnamed protein product [Hymenolepis diminuta]|uniref:Sortilin n=1 Tax=Hymenolepis diminuta TaxID=6216 RepID=A0A158QC27_HYMDI|nr:unnamed protein product [Hymenolepis diminuta]